jgi:flagellar biosynthetic protein FliR
MEFTVDAAWITGVLLASIRVAGFVGVSPIFKPIPRLGRTALVLVLGYAFADPVAHPGDLGVLIGGGFSNAVIGVALGFLTGLIFHLFTIAGSMIDFTSSLAVASIFDPMTGTRTTIFGRIFNLMALAMFLLLGGDRLLVSGLSISFDTVAITGALSLSGGLAEIAVNLLGRLMIASIELAMPALAALFIAEVVLGIAARFAPQSNVFLIGLPVKLFAALASLSAVLLLVPETMNGVLNIVSDTFRTALRGM